MQYIDQPPNCTGHDLPAQKYTSHGEGTSGREFFRCSKPIGEPQCPFFQWVDNELRTPEIRTSILPPTPTSGKRPAVQIYPGSPPSAAHIKRNSQGSEDERAHDRKRARVTKAFNSPGSLPHINNEKTYSGWSSWGSAWPPRTPPRIGWDVSATSVGAQHDNIAMTSSSSQETLRDDSGPSIDMSPESIRDIIRNLNSIPDYVQRLDRKRIAAEKSRDAKKSKVESLTISVQSLEEEVKKLKAREKELEQVVAAYEQ